jgi:hypothetical protein
MRRVVLGDVRCRGVKEDLWLVEEDEAKETDAPAAFVSTYTARADAALNHASLHLRCH